MKDNQVNNDIIKKYAFDVPNITNNIKALLILDLNETLIRTIDEFDELNITKKDKISCDYAAIQRLNISNSRGNIELDNKYKDEPHRGVYNVDITRFSIGENLKVYGYRRRGVTRLFAYCAERGIDIGVSTMGDTAYANAVITNLLPDMKYVFIFMKEDNNNNNNKNLKNIRERYKKYNRFIIIDDRYSVYKEQLNGEAIRISRFENDDVVDENIANLRYADYIDDEEDDDFDHVKRINFDESNIEIDDIDTFNNSKSVNDSNLNITEDDFHESDSIKIDKENKDVPPMHMDAVINEIDRLLYRRQYDSTSNITINSFSNNENAMDL